MEEKGEKSADLRRRGASWILLEPQLVIDKVKEAVKCAGVPDPPQRPLGEEH